MTEDVLNWIKKEKLMTEGDTVIVGLSGGADSVAPDSVCAGAVRARRNTSASFG